MSDGGRAHELPRRLPATLSLSAEWLRGQDGIGLLLLAGVTALYLAGSFVPLPPSSPAGAAFICLPLLAGALAIWLIARASRTPHVDSRTQQAWRLVGLAELASLVGDAIWALQEAQGRQPSPETGSLAYLSYYALLFWALLRFPGSRPSGAAWPFFMDLATVVFGGGIAVWFFALEPRLEALHGGPDSAYWTLAYPAGDLLLVFGLALAVLRRRSETSRPVFRLVAAALAVILAGDLFWGVAELGRFGAVGGWDDRLLTLGLLLWGAAAFVQRRVGAADPLPGVAGPGASLSLLPYGAASVGVGVLLLMGWQRRSVDLGVTAVAGVLLLRQFFALKENLRLQTLAATRRGEARFRSLVQNSSDAILVVDETCRIGYHTPSASRMMATGREALEARLLTEFMDATEAEPLRRLIAEVAGGAVSRTAVESRIRRDDGSYLYVEVSAVDLREDEDVGGIVLTLRDVHQRKLLERQLAEQAVRDPLTGLANRALLGDRLRHTLSRLKREGGALAVLYLDLDDFKRINDSLGHSVGDSILREMARRLRACVRDTDTAARLGGDEFAVLLERPDGAAEVRQVCERILVVMQRPFAAGGRELSLTISLGVALDANGHGTPDALVRNADLAMYAAKKGGKNRLVFFEAEQHVAALARLELEAGLAGAVAKGELVVMYQPIFDLGAGTWAGAEALTRWRHPTRGLLGPDEFIGLAEQAGQIVALGRFVLFEACRNAAGWPRQASGDKPFVSVNVSALQLESPGLVASVREILGETGLHPTRLVLEVTESVVTKGRDILLETYDGLEALGVRLAIDDFGTGYSSLRSLQDLPAQLLKIDKVFVEHVAGSEAAARLLRGIVEFATALGLTTVAEGIETAEQARRLRDFGCALGQGYVFSPAVPADQLERAVARAVLAAAGA